MPIPTITDAIRALATRDNGTTALHLCKNAEDTRTLLKFGFDVNAKDVLGHTPLHVACSWKRSDVVDVLVAAGADVNAKNNAGSTSLHLACGAEDTSAIDILVKHGADVNARTKNGWTPLHNAAKYGSLKAAQLLVEAGAYLRMYTDDGRMPLNYAKTDDMKTLLTPKPLDAPKEPTPDFFTALRALIDEYE